MVLKDVLLTMPARAAALALVAAAAGCGASPSVYRGHYSVGFEKREFVPCGSPERWWATGPLAASLAVQAGTDRGEGTIFVEWRGKKSSRGHFGHLGVYDRELEVRKVIRTHAAGPNDCR